MQFRPMWKPSSSSWSTGDAEMNDVLSAQRLWNFSEELCERALTALTASGFLARASDGSYVRRSAAPANVGRVASPVGESPLVCESRGAIT